MTREEIVLGAFARRANALPGDVPVPVTRRASGGPALSVGAGTVHVVLSLPRTNALVADADASRIVNRHVRPLLRALGRLGARAAFFGRDAVVVGKHPVAWVGFAHDAATDRAIFEAFVSVTRACTVPAGRDGTRARSEPTASTLAEVTGAPVSPVHVAAAVGDAYLAAYPSLAFADLAEGVLRAPDHDRRAPFPSVLAAPIGFVGAIAAPGDFALGGDLLASADLLALLGDALRTDGEAGVFAALADARGVIDGVRGETLIAAARGALLAAARSGGGHDEAREGPWPPRAS